MEGMPGVYDGLGYYGHTLFDLALKNTIRNIDMRG
jgi:hypothetical protein